MNNEIVIIGLGRVCGHSPRTGGGSPWVCIDEWKARREAPGAGLKVFGVSGLLSMAKKLRIIDAVSSFITKATAKGIRYHSDLVNRVLEAMGEK